MKHTVLHLIVYFCSILYLSGDQQNQGAVTNAADQTTLGIADLRCEYLTNPLGINTVLPRLSWRLVDDAHTRGQKQTAYEILIATDPSLLNEAQADIWKTGKVTSHQSALITFDGEPLTSGKAYYWKVRAWDKEQKPTAWSEPARFVETIFMVPHPGERSADRLAAARLIILWMPPSTINGIDDGRDGVGKGSIPISK